MSEITYILYVDGLKLHCTPELTRLYIFPEHLMFMNYIKHQLFRGDVVKVYDHQNNIDDMVEYGFPWTPIQYVEQLEVDDYVGYQVDNLDYEIEDWLGK